MSVNYGPNDFTIGLSEVDVYDAATNALIDLGGEVSNFRSNEMYDDVDPKTISSGGKSKFRSMPTGHEGSFELLRYGPEAETFFYNLAQVFYTQGTSNAFNIRHHIRNGDGTVTVWMYVNCALKMTAAGEYSKDTAVMQTITFRAVDKVPG